MDSSLQTAWNVIMKPPTRIVKPFSWSPGPGRMGLAEREEIRSRVAAGSDAHRHRCPTRPVELDGLPERSRPMADEATIGLGGPTNEPTNDPCGPNRGSSRHPNCGGDADCRCLRKWWSPREISKRLRLEHPDDPMMWVSHETIYKTLFIQGRGELRRELTRCLRSGRAEGRPQGRLEPEAESPAWS